MRSNAREQTTFTAASTSFSVTVLSTRATFSMWARFRRSNKISLEWRQVDRFGETVHSSSETTKRSDDPRVYRFFKRYLRLLRAVEPFVPRRIRRRHVHRPN